MSEAMASPPKPPARVRPFYWSVRRELWENRSIYLAPLSVAGIGLFGFLVSTFRLPRLVRAAEQAKATLATHPVDPAVLKAAHKALHALELPYDFVAGTVFLSGVVVAVFYCLGALYGERRDRSVLFWKSLPVSDLTTVLSKAFLPLVIMPVVVCAIVLAAHLVMLTWSAMVIAAHGIPLTAWTDHLPFPFMWPAFARGMIIMALWYAPVVGWLLLVSGWARRVPILWAVLPWLGLLVVDALAFNSKLVLPFLSSRLAGGFVQAFTSGAQGEKPVHQLADLDPIPVLANPELWLGLVLAAGCIFAAVRLRRYRDPI